MGVARVRILIATAGLAPPLYAEAIKWLAQADEEERARNEASMAAQLREARSANRMAKIAAITAIVAAVMAAISIVISYLAWMHPVH